MPQMGIDNLRAELTNPARNYNWEVLIPNPVGGADSEMLLLRCQSSQIPGRSVGNIAVPFKQTAGLQYAGKLTYSHTWECNFIESEDAGTFNAMYNWAQAIIGDREGLGNGDDSYKTDVYITLITTKGTEFMRIKLRGCFIGAIADVPVNYSEEGIISYPVTFRFDSWEKV